jgi:hypothetical protein
MRFYPDLPARRLRSLVRDVLIVAGFSLPYGRLVAFTRDPFGDLASEHYGPLVDAALAEVGLSRSDRARPRRSRGALERFSRT